MLEFFFEFAFDIAASSVVPVGRGFITLVSFGHWSCEDEVIAGIVGAVVVIPLVIGIALLLNGYR